MTIFWGFAPCNVTSFFFRSFGEKYCLHLHCEIGSGRLSRLDVLNCMSRRSEELAAVIFRIDNFVRDE